MIRYTILQINHRLDDRNYMFMSQEFLLGHGDPFPPPHKIYEEVYADCQEMFDPEAVFTRFNINHPEDYRGRSLSISDIIRYHLPNGETLDLYCDHIGYVGIDLRNDHEIAKGPEFSPSSDRTLDVASLFYNKNGKMKTVNVNISKLISGKCVGVDENGGEIKLSPAEIYNALRICVTADAKYREEIKSLNEKFMELINQGGKL